MSLAAHDARPDVFRLHPEIEGKRVDGVRTGQVDPRATGDGTFLGPEVETNTDYDGHPATILKRTGWVPASDGSIIGAEWKGPLMLADDPIPEEITRIIDESEYGNRCGGHIHVIRGKWGGMLASDAHELLCDNWCWLFSLLYPDRSVNTYSNVRGGFSDRVGNKLPKENRDYHKRDKYSWLRMLSEHRLEFRIFPEVRSTLRLRNRMKLLETLMTCFHLPKNPDEAWDVTMDVITPVMRKNGAFINFPRKSLFKKATANLGGYVFWPKNIKFQKKWVPPLKFGPDELPFSADKQTQTEQNTHEDTIIARPASELPQVRPNVQRRTRTRNPSPEARDNEADRGDKEASIGGYPPHLVGIGDSITEAILRQADQTYRQARIRRPWSEILSDHA